MSADPSARLRPATPEDRFLIRRWLARCDVRATWGSAAGAEAEITLAMGSIAAISRIVERNGAPVGYAHAIETGVLAEHRPEGVPAGAWSVACLMTSEASDGPAFAAAALAQLAGEVFATTLAVACSAVVPVTSEATMRAYERAGFRWVRVWLDPVCGPSWVMLKERSTTPPPRRADRPRPADGRG